jgi:hypothetical protein
MELRFLYTSSRMWKCFDTLCVTDPICCGCYKLHNSTLRQYEHELPVVCCCHQASRWLIAAVLNAASEAAAGCIRVTSGGVLAPSLTRAFWDVTEPTNARPHTRHRFKFTGSRNSLPIRAISAYNNQSEWTYCIKDSNWHSLLWVSAMKYHDFIV